MMQRREFLAHLMRSGVAGSAMLLSPGVSNALPTSSPEGTARRVSVLDFGADGSGQKDCTEAVRRAIAALTKRNARLVFPAGKYLFTTPGGVVMDFSGFEGLEIFGNGAELFFTGDTLPLRIAQCRDLEVHDVIIDWVRPPVSQGVVRAVDNHSVTVAVDRGYPVTGAERFTAMVGFEERAKSTLITGPVVSGNIGAVEMMTPQVLKIAVAAAPHLAEGARVALLHSAGVAPAIRLEGCDQVLLESLQLHASPDTAISLAGCRDITLDTVYVVAHPGTGRAFSANGCGVEMLDCTGAVTVAHARLGGTFGPSMRIQQSYWQLVQISGPQAALLSTRDGKPVEPWALPRAGSYLQLSEAGTLKLLGEIAVTKAEPAPGGMNVTFEETLSPAVGKGTLLCLSATDQPRLKLENCAFSGGASTGLVAQSRARLQNTSFAGYAGPAVLLAPDLTRMRGPVVENVHINDCRFDSCELDASVPARGTVVIDTSAQGGAPTAIRVNEGITVQGNTFNHLGGPAVYCAGASWLDIESNHFNDCDLRRAAGTIPRALVLHNLTDSTITLNDARADASIVMTECTDKVKASDNGTLSIAKA